MTIPANARRVHPPGVVPLELWDVEVRGQRLVEARESPDFCGRVAEMVGLLCSGAAQRHSRESLDARCRAIDFVWVGGGGALRPELLDAFADTGIPFVRSLLGRFCSESGGFALALKAGSTSPLVVDVGQTAIKLSWPGGRRVVERDFSRLPVSPDHFDAQSRAATRRFVSDAMRQAPRPDLVVLALPSRIDDALCPEGSTYSGMGGDSTFVGEILCAATLHDLPTLVLNDAELAALSARAQVAPTATALVLTLGFSVGGALLLPDRPSAGYEAAQ